ncbi:MAG: ABC transporter substrate-binding protein [Chloroflexi bacterium]|nr:ABC transporter substrate-binding protein [Chloroflexota bacterium]
MKAKFYWLLTMVVLASLLLSACGPTPTPVPPTPVPPAATPVPPTPTPKPVQVVIAIGGDPSTLDPQYADDGNERAVNDNIYEMLLFRDPKTMAIVPGLAESYKQVDATTWRLTLRKGIKFHNGEELNAAAVVFSVKRILDPAFKSQQLSYVEGITGAKAVDDYTVDIITSGPLPILPVRLTWLKIVPPKYAKEKAAEFPNHPVGTGPYKFVEWKKGDHVTLEANQAYWGGAPKINRVIIRPIPEEATRLAALKAGEVDLVRGLIPEYVKDVPKAAHMPGLEFPWIRINTRKGKLADLKVRQALNYAVDKEALAKSLYGGFAVPADGQLLTKGHFGYNPGVKAFPYDLTKAKALLKEAGAVGMSVELIGESGRWLKDKELIEAVAGQLTEAGLKVNVKIVEWKAWLDLLFAGAEKAPDLQFSSHDNELLDASRTLSGLFTSKGNQAAYANPEVDKLVEAAATETDLAKREEMYRKAVKIINEEAACIFLLNLENIYGLSKRLEWTPRLDGRVLVKEMTVSQ